MANEKSIMRHCVAMLGHISDISNYFEVSRNYSMIMNFAIRNLEHVNPEFESTKLKKHESIYSISEWAIELVRLALSTGREVNRLRNEVGLQPIIFEKEAVKLENKNAKGKTNIPKE